MTLQVHCWDYQAEVPSAAVPAWEDLVPRWQQMDPVARAVTDAWYHWFGKTAGRFPPERLIVASRAASHLADLDFARTGAFSPQKFVATLPSVVAAPVLKITQQILPVLGLQNGERTLSTAFGEAALLADGGGTQGILTFDPGDLLLASDQARCVRVRYFAVHAAASQDFAFSLQHRPEGAGLGLADEHLHAWLDAGAARKHPTFPLGGSWELGTS